MLIPERLDDVDHTILRHLQDDARQPATEIAKHLEITAGAVRRRIERLEERGVINHYTVVLNHAKVRPSVEAYLELTFEGEADVPAFLARAVKRPEIREASTIAGNPDAVVRLRVDSLEHLRETVTELRRMGPVTGSKTLVALDRYRHVSERDD
jgi:DNA-binding Lrp family transcriptional regulator